MSRRVCIGVTVHADPATLLETLRFVRLHTDPSVELVLLPDGADKETRDALAAEPILSSLVQLPTPEARGGPACFNRLASATDAEVIVLLESGSLVGPHWLELLLAALDEPGCGLAGPSTNMAWNDQALPFPSAATLASVQGAATQAFLQHGRTVRPLLPLHSLSDFCYAVRREVIAAIGGADEGYGLGPCWEMDYNIQAARAGFVALWACGAYVYRCALTTRRVMQEASLHDASRRRYQDRFCGLHLTGQTIDYEPRCRGEACEHFAPVHLSPRRLPPPELERRLSEPPAPAPCGDVVAPSRRAPPVAVSIAPPRVPLVSCIMPTRGRTDFALQAARYFQRQDYPHLELVIVEDGVAALAGVLPHDPRIRLTSSGMTRTIGAMRNHACALARGEMLVLWDDDDWHGPGRVSSQVAPILAGDADVTALRDVPLFDVGAWRSWRWSPELHRRMLALDVLGGTLAFRRSVWEAFARYPDDSLAEDAAFVREAVGAGARLRSLDATDVYVYIRHGENSWQLDCGESVDRNGWLAVAEPSLPAPDLAFYRLLTGIEVSPSAADRGS